MKRESTWIEFKKSHQLTNCIPHWIPIFVEPPAIMEDVTSGFDWIRSAWTVKAFSWEKSQMIFPYWSMVCDSSSGSCT